MMPKRLLLWNFVLFMALTGPLSSDRAWGEVLRVTPVVKAQREAGLAVVNISAKKIITNCFGLFGRDPLADIYRRPINRKSAGSGVILHEDGHVRYWTAIKAANPAVRSLRERTGRR